MRNIYILLKVCFVCTVSLFVLDRFLIYAGISTTSPFTTDQESGLIPRPDFLNVVHNEGFFIGKTNSDGTLGSSISKSRSDESIRIGIIGDSFVKGNQLFHRNHFQTLMKEKLSQELGKNVEVVNFGRVRFSFDNMYLYYQDVVSEYELDMVLFVVGYPNFKFTKTGGNSLPGIELDGNTLKKKISFLESNQFTLYKKYESILSGSSIIWMFAKNVLSKQKRQLLQTVFDKFYIKNIATSQTFGKHDVVDYDLSDKHVTIIETLYESSDNIVFVLRQGITGLEILLNQKEKNYIQLYKGIAEASNQGIDVYSWVQNKKGHWNHQGHEIIGEYIYDAIINENLLGNSTH